MSINLLGIAPLAVIKGGSELKENAFKKSMESVVHSELPWQQAEKNAPNILLVN